MVSRQKRTPSFRTDISGSNLQALLDASGTSRLPAQITYVLSSRSNAYGLQRAANHDPLIPTSVCALKTFMNRNPGATREDYDAEVARRVLDSRPDLVVLAGWMHILSDAFLDILNGAKPPPPAPALPPPEPASLPTQTEPIPSQSPTSPSAQQPGSPQLPLHQSFPIPCINLHPALPGAFDGAKAIERAFEAYEKGEIQETGVMVHRVVREVDRGEPLVVRSVPCQKGQTLEQLESRIHQVSIRLKVLHGSRNHRWNTRSLSKGLPRSLQNCKLRDNHNNTASHARPLSVDTRISRGASPLRFAFR